MNSIRHDNQQIVSHGTDIESATNQQHMPRSSTPISSSSPPMETPAPPIVYGELSILGYNGYIPSGEKSGRRNRSKYLLCKRGQPNGIKKSRHYIVKQPQATRAIQDKDLHSISYTFSRSQTIIVEYKQDDRTDMFQIGRSSEDPIDFVVMDTQPAGRGNLIDSSASAGNQSGHQQGRHSGKHYASSAVATAASSSALGNYAPPQYPNHHHPNHNENSASSSHQHQQQHQLISGDLAGISRFHRHLAKVGEEMLQYGFPPNIHDLRDTHYRVHTGHGQPMHLVNYPPPNITNLPPMVANHFRFQELPMFHHQSAMAGGSQQPHQYIAQASANSHNNQRDHLSNRHPQQNGRRNSDNLMCKRSHTTQSTISRFACRVLVDREPPFTARIYAAGFDSSKNIFLGEKATKWEQNNSIDGLTTNGVLLLHPKRGYFYEQTSKGNDAMDVESDNEVAESSCSNNQRSAKCNNNQETTSDDGGGGGGGGVLADQESKMNSSSESHEANSRTSNCHQANNSDTNVISSFQNKSDANDSNNNTNGNRPFKIADQGTEFEYGGVWREVSVDGGIYAIRESRSAVQKGKRIESETNILQDGTLIDLCGATLLWRSLDGFKSAPTKRALEEKVDILNASRPQCPVGLNTLVIPRRPILPNSEHRSERHRRHHENKDQADKSGHQPYVYLKCGHVQGYHDWGATAKSNQRTCPICLSVGNVAKLSMGLEPSFYVDSGPLTHVFNPCGHMASERTVRYWSSIDIPHGTHFFHSICPFCATPLTTNEPAATKLIFQEDLD